MVSPFSKLCLAQFPQKRLRSGRAGGFPAGPPTEPDVNDSLIRLLGNLNATHLRRITIATLQAHIQYTRSGIGSGNVLSRRANFSQVMEPR